MFDRPFSAFAALLFGMPAAARIEASVLFAEQAERNGGDNERADDEQESEPGEAQSPPIDMTRPHGRFDAFA